MDVPGGTGKNMSDQLTVVKVRGQQSFTIDAASSETVDALLPNGRTTHASFNLSPDIDKTDQASCTANRPLNKAKVLKRAKINHLQ